MTDGTLYDFSIAIDYSGNQHVLDPPEGYDEWLEWLSEDECQLRGLPDEPGVYRVVAKAWCIKGYCDGNRDPSGDEWGFAVIEYEEMRLVGSGTVVPVIHEAIDR